MMFPHNCVTLQLTLLMISGVWPVWRLPFRKCKSLNTVLMLYSTLITVLWGVRMYQNTYWLFDKMDSGQSIAIRCVRNIGEVCVRISILCLSLFGHNKVLYCQSLWNQQSKRYKTSNCVMFAVLVAFEATIIVSSWEWTRRIHVEVPDSGGVLPYMEAIAKPFQSVIANVLQVTLFPTTLVLSHSCAVYNEFKSLEDDIKTDIASQTIYLNNNYISGAKRKFLDICKAANSVNNLFRYCIVFSTFTISMNIFSYTFFWSLNACDYMKQAFSYFVLLMCNFVALLFLCISGTLITSAVSTLFIPLKYPLLRHDVGANIICCPSSGGRHRVSPWSAGDQETGPGIFR